MIFLRINLIWNEDDSYIFSSFYIMLHNCYAKNKNCRVLVWFFNILRMTVYVEQFIESNLWELFLNWKNSSFNGYIFKFKFVPLMSVTWLKSKVFFRFLEIMVKYVDGTLKTWIIHFHVILCICIIVSSNQKLCLLNF